jgi:hypothetical protein
MTDLICCLKAMPAPTTSEFHDCMPLHLRILSDEPGAGDDPCHLFPDTCFSMNCGILPILLMKAIPALDDLRVSRLYAAPFEDHVRHAWLRRRPPVTCFVTHVSLWTVAYDALHLRRTAGLSTMAGSGHGAWLLFTYKIALRGPEGAILHLADRILMGGNASRLRQPRFLELFCPSG